MNEKLEYMANEIKTNALFGFEKSYCNLDDGIVYFEEFPSFQFVIESKTVDRLKDDLNIEYNNKLLTSMLVQVLENTFKLNYKGSD